MSSDEGIKNLQNLKKINMKYHLEIDDEGLRNLRMLQCCNAFQHLHDKYALNKLQCCNAFQHLHDKYAATDALNKLHVENMFFKKSYIPKEEVDL